MTTSRKISLGVMVIAISVLVWDKTIHRSSVSEPSSVEGSWRMPGRLPAGPPDAAGGSGDLWEAAAIQALASPAPSPEATEVGSPSDPAIPFGPGSDSGVARTFGRLGGRVVQRMFSGPSGPQSAGMTAASRRDLFVATEEFRQAIQPPAPPVSAPSTEEVLAEAARQLQLTGIVIGPRKHFAQINQKIVTTGDRIGPFQVRQILPDRVILATETGSVELRWKR
ncbi:MAG: hypothetical protein JW810_01790 [Sedimentisphaerales bacterium]|nr:hypothetical protein [Sedimentisphaerales bacterium]